MSAGRPGWPLRDGECPAAEPDERVRADQTVSPNGVNLSHLPRSIMPEERPVDPAAFLIRAHPRLCSFSPPVRSAIRHSLHLFGVPVTLHRHRGGGVGDLAKLVRRKFQG